jgi:hypothetical protein
VSFTSVKAEVRDDDLPFEVRHEEKSEDERTEVPQLCPIEPGENRGAGIE